MSRAKGTPGLKTMTLRAFKQAYRAALGHPQFCGRSYIEAGQPVQVYTQEAAFCPITAVCYHKTGTYFLSWNAHAAARQIGLSSGLAFLIICAADQLEKGPSRGTLTRWLQETTMRALDVLQDLKSPGAV